MLNEDFEDINIGILLGQTGPITDATSVMFQAAEMAIEEINESGSFFNGLILKSFHIDSTSTNSTVALENLVSVDSQNPLSLLIGGDTSAITSTVLEAFSYQNEVLTISPSATAPFLQDNDDQSLFYRTATPDTTTANLAAAALHRSGAKNVAILAENSTYAEAYIDTFVNTFRGLAYNNIDGVGGLVSTIVNVGDQDIDDEFRIIDGDIFRRIR